MLKFNNFLKESTTDTHVTTFMRANPPTAGHEQVVNKVLETAKKVGGSHSVVLSHSQDSKKNPLSPSQKLKHARRAFPGANLTTSSKESPSLLSHVAKLHGQGVKNLHIVVGQDRVNEFKTLLNKYNGVKGSHGHYNFDKIEVHSAGDRDPDSEGTKGISGTKMREHASNNDLDNFSKGVSSAMKPEHAKEMFNDVRNGMKK